jgi:nucleoside transporter
MADKAIGLDYTSANLAGKPPLDPGVRLRLSAMMFLQFAVWGSWFVVFSNYCMAPARSGGLGFDGAQTGSLYGTVALGAIISTLFAGQLADRVLSSEYLMAIFHLLGAVLLVAMATIHGYAALWWTSLAYALLYNPTIAISSSLSFHNVPDAARDFPMLRVFGTLGWIAANLAVDHVLPSISHLKPEAVASSNWPLLMAAVLSAGLGLFSFALPHTPPSGQKGDTLAFLKALRLLKDSSFAIFFSISFLITIAMAFYYGFIGKFEQSVGVTQIATISVIGQAVEIAFMLLLPIALIKLGMKWVLGVGMAAWVLRYLLFSMQHPFVVVIIGIALHGVCFDFFFAAGFIHTDNKSPASIRASAQAFYTFLTYGVGMWIGNMISGEVVNHWTAANGSIAWTKVWLVPAAIAAFCLLLFLGLWHDRPGKLEEEEFRELAPILVTPLPEA